MFFVKYEESDSPITAMTIKYDNITRTYEDPESNHDKDIYQFMTQEIMQYGFKTKKRTIELITSPNRLHELNSDDGRIP